MQTQYDTFEKLAGALDSEALKDPVIFNQTYHACLQRDQQEGLLKTASALGTQEIKRRLREKPFFRQILPPDDVSDRHFDRAMEHDLPRIIEDMEFAIRKPRVVPFGQPPEVTPVRGNKFEIIFYELQTPEFIFQTERLRTYRMDVRQITTDAMLMDLGELEDRQGLGLVDEIVGQSTGVGLAGYNQHNLVNGAISRANWKNIKNNINDRHLNIGVSLMNRKTGSEFEGWPHDELGGPAAYEVFRDGAKALGKFTPGGVPTLVTINNHLVPNNWIYQFTEPGYLGRFYIMEQVQVMVKRERNWIRQSAKTQLGITIANVHGLHLTRYTQST